MKEKELKRWGKKMKKGDERQEWKTKKQKNSKKNEREKKNRKSKDRRLKEKKGCLIFWCSFFLFSVLLTKRKSQLKEHHLDVYIYRAEYLTISKKRIQKGKEKKS